MIYETLLNCVDDLTTRWTGVQSSANLLATALAASPAQQAIVTGWATTSGTQAAALTAGRPALENFPPLATLFAAAQPLFANSDAALTLINTTAAGLLPALVTSPNTSISAPAGDVQSRLADLGVLIAECLQEIIELQSNEGTRANIGGIRSSVDDISTYPVLTQDMSWGPISMPPSIGGGSTTSSLGQIAAKALSEVLGRRPRLNDPKSFISALNDSFICKDVEGHTECVWTARAPSGTTELGGSVTGAQASIYMRAKEASDAVLPLVEGFIALRVDANPEDTEAVRSIVKSEFGEVVKEFGMEGGPRVDRVDDLFELLIGYGPGTIVAVPPAPPTPPTPRGDFIVTMPGYAGLVSANPDLLAAFGGGEIGRLGDAFGFTRDQVNTIEQEQNLTNYLVLRDYVLSLYTGWQSFRGSFLGGVNNYLGTQLILLQRTLSVVAESVVEITFAMDSVFLGPAERQTVRIDFPIGVAAGPMYVDDLLTWVQNFASAEGTRIVEEGGKLGVRSIVPTLQLLQRLVQNSVGRIRHPGARHPRVRRTLSELASQLNEAARLAGTIQ